MARVVEPAAESLRRRPSAPLARLPARHARYSAGSSPDIRNSRLRSPTWDGGARRGVGRALRAALAFAKSHVGRRSVAEPWGARFARRSRLRSPTWDGGARRGVGRALRAALAFAKVPRGTGSGV